MNLATVTSASPLEVRTDLATTSSPARLLSRGDSYAPALDDRVVVDVISGRLYVIGAA